MSDYLNRYITEKSSVVEDGVAVDIVTVYYTKDGLKAKVRSISRYKNGSLVNRKRYRENGRFIDEIDKESGKGWVF